jgi:hypothetical protein
MLVALILLSTVWAPVPQPGGRLAAAEPAGYQLLTNPGLENYDPPYDQFRDIPCQVASGWQRFWTGANEPCWMDTRIFAASNLGGGWVERIEGETSQMILSTEPYDAGIWQQVSGLVPGTGYGFHAAMLTIFQTSAQDPVHGTMIKQVGIDPTGGTDPRSPTIVWSPPDDHDQGPWDIDSITSAYAQASTVTVFVRVNSLYPSGGLPYLNLSFMDSAILAQTGTVSAVAPALTAAASFLVRWDNAVASPEGKIKWYDVQWLDEAEGIWRDWLVWTKSTSATFAGKMGHAYRFRARVWQEYPNGAHLFSPFAADGDARTCAGCSQVWGRVLSHDGRPLVGATVALDGGYATTSQAGGTYSLTFPSPDEPVSLIASARGWSSPPPLFDLNLAPQESLAMTWTLSLPGDAIANGDFEAGLDDWSVGSGVMAVGEPVHTGRVSATLTGSPSIASLGQTAVISGTWEPCLAFWYRPGAASAGDLFQVAVTVDGGDPAWAEPSVFAPPLSWSEVLTPSLAAGGWQFFSRRLGPADAAFSGTVTVEFRLLEDGQAPAAVLYLDEVRLAPTPGGPFKIYLPLLNRQF